MGLFFACQVDEDRILQLSKFEHYPEMTIELVTIDLIADYLRQFVERAAGQDCAHRRRYHGAFDARLVP
jgi:hypothetical protein